MATVLKSSEQPSSEQPVGSLPDINRVSVLAAMIVLAYTLSNFISIPEREISAQIPGFYLNITVNIDSITAFLVAGLTATGADWLLRDHPLLRNKVSAFPHWILPSLTALVIGIPLNQLPYGPVWWGGLLLGTVVVVLVLIGEFISIDDQDARHMVAAAGLSAVAYVLFLVLVSALRTQGLRLFIVIPMIVISLWMVCMRVMHLRLHGEWTVYEAGIIALIVGQLSAAFHYWSLSPISYGLVLLGLAYALTSLVCGLIEEKPLRKIMWEPIITILLTWSTAFWIV
jgi:Protein of unknown function (DUF5656)